MAVILKRSTSHNMLLKLVPIQDTAIDWERSCVDAGESEEERKSSYVENHDLRRLVFKEDDKPTLFVFNHPRRVDIARKLRSVYTKQIGNRQSDDSDLFTDVWDKAFVGTEDGVDGGAMTPVQRRGGRITDEYFQSLEDSGVFGELALAYLQTANAERVAEEETAKKK